MPPKKAKSAKPANKQKITTVNSAKVSNLDPDTPMGIDPATKAVPNAELADAQDDVMADPALPGQDADEDEDSGLDEAADLEMMDAMNEAGEFDTEDEDVDEDEDVEIDGEEEDGDVDVDVDSEDLDEEPEEDEGVPLPPDAELPLIGATPSKNRSAPETSVATTESTLHPTRPTPYTIDAGHLLITDSNPLVADTEAALAANARDATQTLLNHLLTTCPIRTLPPNLAAGSSTAGVTITLPTPETDLPREKKIPTPKEETTWERFAKKKGIGKYNQLRKKGQEGEGRAGKMVYDEAKGEWVPRYGYKGKNKDGENDWLVEIDEKKNGDANGDPRALKRTERKERVKRNERKMRANAAKSVKGKGA